MAHAGNGHWDFVNRVHDLVGILCGNLAGCSKRKTDHSLLWRQHLHGSLVRLVRDQQLSRMADGAVSFATSLGQRAGSVVTVDLYLRGSDLLKLFEWFEIALQGQSIHGDSRQAADAIDQSASLDHDFQQGFFSVQVKQISFARCAAQKANTGSQAVSAPVADATND